MVSVWDAETRASITACRAPGGNEVCATLALLKALVRKGCIVTADALHCHAAMAEAVLATGADYALGLKGSAPQNIAIIRRIALDMLNAHPDKRSIARKMKLASWKKEFFFELFAYMQ